MISWLVYQLWLFWDVEIEHPNAIKGIFATFSCFEVTVTLVVVVIMATEWLSQHKRH